MKQCEAGTDQDQNTDTATDTTTAPGPSSSSSSGSRQFKHTFDMIAMEMNQTSPERCFTGANKAPLNKKLIFFCLCDDPEHSCVTAGAALPASDAAVAVQGELNLHRRLLCEPQITVRNFSRGFEELLGYTVRVKTPTLFSPCFPLCLSLFLLCHFLLSLRTLQTENCRRLIPVLSEISFS